MNVLYRALFRSPHRSWARAADLLLDALTLTEGKLCPNCKAAVNSYCSRHNG